MSPRARHRAPVPTTIEAPVAMFTTCIGNVLKQRRADTPISAEAARGRARSALVSRQEVEGTRNGKRTASSRNLRESNFTTRQPHAHGQKLAK